MLTGWVTDDDGNTATAKLDDVQYATDGDAVLAYGAAEFGEDGAEVLRIHQEGQDVSAYLTDAARAYKTGLQQGKLNNTGSLTTDYICNPENLKLRFEKHQAEIDAANRLAMYKKLANKD